MVDKNGFLDYWVTSVRKNELDDFDFSVETTDGPKIIELMEIAPLEDVEGGHEAAPSKHDNYEFAEWIFGKILEKSRKYRGSADDSLILLTYVTDWKFWPGMGAQSLLQYWALTKPHNFEEIHFHVPADGGGIGWPVYPTPEENWEEFDAEQIRGTTVQNLDPDGWEVGSLESDD